MSKIKVKITETESDLPTGIFIRDHGTFIGVMWKHKTINDCRALVRTTLAALLYAKETKQDQEIEVEEAKG